MATDKERDRIDGLMRHIDHVRNNCVVLGERLISNGNPIGRILIANGFIHDNSKFYGIEWEYLTDRTQDPELMKAAVKQHNTTNPHHPEYWGSISAMPSIYMAEMVCDWAARSSEFGTSLQDWINDGAAKRFGYEKDSDVHMKICLYAGMLCEKPFNSL